MNAQFDPLAATRAADPYPDYARLVRERPLAYDARLGLWVVASAAAVEAALLHPALRVRPADEPVPRALVGTSSGEIFARLARMNDGEGHDRVKSAIARAFGVSDIAELRRHAERLAPGVLVARPLGWSTDGDRADALALRLPALTIAAWLGFEDAALGELAADAAALATSFTPGASPDAIARGSAAAERMLGAVDNLLATGSGRGPLQSMAAAVTAYGGRASEAAPTARRPLAANAVGFFTQAYEATAGLIGNTLLALAREPAARSCRARHEDLSACVAEVARFDPPVHNTRRFVAETCTLLGQPLATGDAILVVLAAANRDPAANPQPDRFDAGRPAPRSFTFGAGGHACPGAALATTLATAAVAAILDAGIDPDALVRRFTYRDASNTRVPLFATRQR